MLHALTGILVLLLILGGAVFAYLAYYIRWERRHTRGLAYYGNPLAQRRATRETIRRKSRFARPILKAVATVAGDRAILDTCYRGVHVPLFKTTRALLDRTFHFEPGASDIIVATQMKCGTTWMQQVVYEILSHGRGDLGDHGHRHLCALSPWIESFDGVSLAAAPRIGRQQARIIKTHLPAELCPYSPRAKYVYVTRHPASCFASTFDFVALLSGPFCPSPEQLADRFCRDRVWLGSWPRHVAGWWCRAHHYPNGLFVHLAALRQAPPAVVLLLVASLGEELGEEELAEVIRKSDFAYMKEHEEHFDMNPPTTFSVSGKFFQSGKTERYEDVDETLRRRIVAFCRRELAGSDYPASQFYPDLAA